MLANISAEYLGLQLNSPIVIGSCPLTRKPEMVRELAIAGAGAVALPSLFEEQVVHELIEQGELPQNDEATLESHCYDSEEDSYNGGIQDYLSLITELKGTIGIPVIANLNGSTGGHWFSIASRIEEAGADALEVSLEPETMDAAASANDIEDGMLNSLSELCDQVSIPVSVKLTMYHTHLANLAWRIAESGAAGLVCFAHEPLWRIEPNGIATSLEWSLTPAGNINPVISGLVRVRAGGCNISVAASGGICVPEDVVKTIISGADVVMVTSEIFRSGPDAVAHMVEGLCSYLNRKGLSSLAELICSRPRPRKSLRISTNRSMMQQREFLDPAPHLQLHAGDRWGHLR